MDNFNNKTGSQSSNRVNNNVQSTAGQRKQESDNTSSEFTEVNIKTPHQLILAPQSESQSDNHSDTSTSYQNSEKLNKKLTNPSENSNK